MGQWGTAEWCHIVNAVKTSYQLKQQPSFTRQKISAAVQFPNIDGVNHTNLHGFFVFDYDGSHLTIQLKEDLTFSGACEVALCQSVDVECLAFLNLDLQQ